LLSTFYKCISGCISERMKGNLDDIISSSQKAYLSNRFIGEATRTTFDTLSVARENNLQGVLLLIDFQKCFDTVSHKLIKKALVFLNFGPDMIKWIHLSRVVAQRTKAQGAAQAHLHFGNIKSAAQAQHKRIVVERPCACKILS